MADQYRVDLSALDETVKKLNSVLKDLGNAHADTRYKTSLSPNALGADAPGATFLEARKLTKAHEVMKQHIEEIVQHLHEVMDKFGNKTKKAHGHYQNQEADVTTSMSGQ
ncbi:hypothetical protein [Streptomyces sp. MST-110588]|uniref:hypothetical protein n=1 Tax=Streptomyces sp. MST-110588 TaxID=2833628 RepID=UPI001F5E123D|nr:hypothetical protein [Streptomyces sp. MST-110588]UNO39651.1 hypothetical protein KGS77_08615 [Streptomyces sp. MST-110588]